MVETEEQAKDYVAGLVGVASMDRLAQYVDLLIAENERQNLISKASEGQIWQRHIADSVQLLEHVSRETLDQEHAIWLDLGTGAGLPGLVIAAIFPDLFVRLVESRARRVEFLRECVARLDLERCEVLGERLERIEPFPASVISARAFAPLDKLLRLSAPFSTRSTTYLLPKGRSAAHELKSQKAPIRKMFHVEQSLTDSDAGIIVSSRTHE
ncbi:16S rRNA (guanine(527)-N(7))-methyltransferase RsmG [Erythrobacter sp. KMU-140]|uniref:Ribosomal RNA small subunit methyltransferase G n=1 Tax=Erythrobacter rubeus TaxID=2760803 RepID=A0ABR8KR19_9SPHN|nr:16S rRNA (guanine(527)-N(7))-methyltransferase RsmG [Erythrobacter rubeus]